MTICRAICQKSDSILAFDLEIEQAELEHLLRFFLDLLRVVQGLEPVAALAAAASSRECRAAA